MSKRKKAMKGVCTFHTETGTEGGYWAFQDGRFITKNVQKPYCKKCGKYLDPQECENLKVIRVLPINQEFLDGKEQTECPDGQHEREVGDSWSYKGMYILRNGDRLTIYHPEDRDVVWQGVVALIQYPPFTEDALGYWIHSEQAGVPRATWAEWFIKEYPAELVPLS